MKALVSQSRLERLPFPLTCRRELDPRFPESQLSDSSVSSRSCQGYQMEALIAEFAKDYS